MTYYTYFLVKNKIKVENFVEKQSYNPKKCKKNNFDLNSIFEK